MIVPEDFRFHMRFAVVYEPLAIVPCMAVLLFIHSGSLTLSLIYLVFLLHSRLVQKYVLDMPWKNMAPSKPKALCS